MGKKSNDLTTFITGPYEKNIANKAKPYQR